jgi:5-methylcytosine-specific restriction endonuclease McrA
MVDDRISEADLILPALYIINRESQTTTSQLIHILEELLKPTGKDAEILKNRRDTYFSQKVRNLVSHDTLERLGYATYSKLGRSGTFTITEDGKGVLQVNKDALEYLLGEDFNYDDFSFDDIKASLATMTKMSEQRKRALLYDENLVISEGTRRKGNVQMYERSKKLRDIAINHYIHNGHIQCCICSFDFFVQYGEWGKGYIEIHHLKPICRYEDEESNMFIERALQNVVPVCSNCHRMIHREKNAPMPIEDLKHLVQRAKISSVPAL